MVVFSDNLLVLKINIGESFYNFFSSYSKILQRIIVKRIIL